MAGMLLVLVIAVAIVVVALVIYALVFARGRQLGTRGIVQRSHLRCPKCQQEFDYDWVPGASFTAVRLGPARYMACPLCHHWSTFDLYGNMVTRPATGWASTPPAHPPASPPMR